MRTLQKISEDEMVAAFLKAEINSPRFGNQILIRLKRDQKDRRIIDNPNTKDEAENNYRSLLLGEYRGFKRNTALFENFPDNIKWERVVLNKDDLRRVKFINYNYWVELSGGSRLPEEAVKHIKAGIEVFGESNKRFWEAAEDLKKGIAFPEMILVSRSKKDDLVVMEGNLRLTAYFLKPEFIPKELEAIVGYSSDFANWSFY